MGAEECIIRKYLACVFPSSFESCTCHVGRDVDFNFRCNFGIQIVARLFADDRHQDVLHHRRHHSICNVDKWKVVLTRRKWWKEARKLKKCRIYNYHTPCSYIEPTITWVPSEFLGTYGLIQKLCLKNTCIFRPNDRLSRPIVRVDLRGWRPWQLFLGISVLQFMRLGSCPIGLMEWWS